MNANRSAALIRRTAPIFALALAAVAGPLRAESLREQLQALAQEQRIAIEGLEKVGAESARPAAGDVAQRVQSLLSDYNYLSVSTGGKLEKLTITSLKQAAPKPKPAPQNTGRVPTQRLGSHHQVQATLSGPSQVAMGATLLVDTGATTVVLPESMAGPLGFSAANLRDGSSQTAGGTVPVKIGMLASMQVGGVVANNVPVSFIPDHKLNGARLLGMSFLSRFRFSLDDGRNELLLQAK
ncbi:MAG: TIGR02281 family clan AA aspartic protease [Candidatus Methylumidiphilus sp.]